MNYLMAIIVALMGAFWVQKRKKDSAEALLENNATKNQLDPLNGKLEANKELEKTEEQKRAQIEKDAEVKKNYDANAKELEDFLDKH